MSTQDYERILRETEGLASEEQLRLIHEIAERLRATNEPGVNRTRLEDLAGSAPYPLCGEDAQEWVRRTRGEGDNRREVP